MPNLRGHRILDIPGGHTRPSLWATCEGYGLSRAEFKAPKFTTIQPFFLCVGSTPV